jgi:hypothetical protein
MIQTYTVIIRSHTRNEKKYTVAFRKEISMLYISICIKYIKIKLDSLINEDGKVYIV